MDWRRMHKLVASLPFRFCGFRVSALSSSEAPLEAALSSTREVDRQSTVRAIGQSVSFAQQLGCDTLLLEAGAVPVTGEVPYTDLGDRSAGWSTDAAGALWARRQVRANAALETLCRSLHGLCKSFPDMTFCLGLSRDVLSLGEPQALAAVFEDLSRYRVGYWHDTTAAACREHFLREVPGRVLEEFSKNLKGMTLGDYGDGECYLPPGAGGVDYPLVSAYRRPSASQFPVVIELDPGVDPGEIPGIHAYLDKFGL